MQRGGATIQYDFRNLPLQTHTCARNWFAMVYHVFLKNYVYGVPLSLWGSPIIVPHEFFVGGAGWELELDYWFEYGGGTVYTNRLARERPDWIGTIYLLH